MRHRLTALAAFVTVTSSASVLLPVHLVFAGDADGTAAAQEETLIKHGIELREKHDDDGALGEFRRAYRLSNGGRALAQMALAEQALGHWVDAETHLTQALRQADDRWIGRNEKLLRQSLANIQGHTGSLEITGAVAGADILINNERVGTFPTPAILVPAGSVALEIRAPGYLPLIRTVLIPARGLAREQVALVAAPATAAIDVPRPKEAPISVTDPATLPQISTRPESPPSPSSATAWSTRTRVGAGLAAGGVVSLAVGIAYQVIREQRARAFNNDQCGVSGGVVTGPTDSDCPSRYDDIQGAQKFALAGFVGAAVLGGVGTYLILSGDRRASDPATARAASRGLHCVPAAAMGVVCSARF